MFTTVSIFIFIIATLILRQPPLDKPEVKSATATPTSQPSPTPISTPSQSPDLPASSPTPNPIPSSSPSPAITQLIYPGSTRKSANIYTTPDSAQTVVEWYKSQINARKFSIKTFVNTTTNGQTRATLRGESGSSVIDVTVTQNPPSPTVITLN